jgi:uncharacterized protein YkwD
MKANERVRLVVTCSLAGAVAGFILGAGVIYQYGEINPNRMVGTPSPSVMSSYPCEQHAEVTHDNVLIKVNEARISAGVPVLSTSRILEDYAQARSNEINANGSYEANNPHQTVYVDLFKFSQDFKRGNESAVYSLYNEEITGKAASSCIVVDGLLASSTHKEGMLSTKSDEIGIGVTNGYVVLEIGDRK